MPKPRKPRRRAAPARDTSGLTPRSILEERVQWLSKKLDKEDGAADLALEGRSFCAAAAYDSEARKTRKELDAALGEIAALDSGERPSGALTQAQFDALYAEWLPAAPDAVIERAVEEWVRRVGAVLVIEGGRAQICYRETG